jgi:hypothetical protein
MDQDVILTLGGEAVAVPPMCFAALKRAWPAIQSMPAQANLVDQASCAVEIVAAALSASRPDLTVAAIEGRLKGSELVGLVTRLPLLLEASGLLPAGSAAPGESPAGS